MLSILSKFLTAIDRVIGNMDRKTLETVRQAGYMVAFLLVAASVGLGIHYGKESSRKGQSPNFTNTDEIFEIDVKRSRQTSYTRTLVESDQIHEITDPELKRILFPTQAGQEPTVSENVVEPETDKKAAAAAVTGADRLSEIDRTDEGPARADVRTLKKRDSSDSAAAPGVLESEDGKEGVVLRKEREDVRRPAREGDDADSPAPGKTIRVYRKKSPNPLDSGAGVIDR
jgi:hypothetical protein